MTTTRAQKARRELERRRAVVLQTTRGTEAELDALRTADHGQEFEEVSQSEQGVADLARLGEAERLELRRIEAAMARIDEGRWGECAECGQPIEARRLEALPWAIRCSACAEARERGVNRSSSP